MRWHVEAPLSARTRRHLELLKLARPLRRHASSLQADPNAAFFLVHQALSAAFTEHLDLRPEGSLEASLRKDIDRSFASWSGRGTIGTTSPAGWARAARSALAIDGLMWNHGGVEGNGSMTDEEALRLRSENAYLKLRCAQLQDDVTDLTGDVTRMRQMLERTVARRTAPSGDR
jgi:hypothetical protein